MAFQVGCFSSVIKTSIISVCLQVTATPHSPAGQQEVILPLEVLRLLNWAIHEG